MKNNEIGKECVTKRDSRRCIECGSHDLYCAESIKEPMMCFPCYAAMTGFVFCGEKNSYVDMDDLELGATS